MFKDGGLQYAFQDEAFAVCLWFAVYSAVCTVAVSPAPKLHTVPLTVHPPVHSLSWIPRSVFSPGALVAMGGWATQSRRTRWCHAWSNSLTSQAEELHRSMLATHVPLLSVRQVGGHPASIISVDLNKSTQIRADVICVLVSCRWLVFLGCH